MCDTHPSSIVFHLSPIHQKKYGSPSPPSDAIDFEPTSAQGLAITTGGGRRQQMEILVATELALLRLSPEGINRTRKALYGGRNKHVYYPLIPLYTH